MAEILKLPGGVPQLRPPTANLPIIAWARKNLFSSWLNSILTIVAVYLLMRALLPVFRWAVLDANWTASNAAECRATGGACWAFVAEKYRFILFGRFPFDEQWRPLLVVFLFTALILVSCNRRFWNRSLGLFWAGGLALIAVLMWGGVFGLPYVDTTLWGGLPLTLILAVLGTVMAFPLSILLALGRRSNMPAVKALCVAFIELWRGVPLITVLFMASVMLPLFLPPGLTIDKVLRALVAITLFSAAYLAEVVRGGLQAIPKGQYEAADSLALTYWQKTGKIILPQALAIVIPPLVNTFIGLFKDTSLVVIIGLFDLLNTAQLSMVDPNWRGFYIEAFSFIGFIYFVYCFFMSRYSQYLEKAFNKGHRR
jgi:general L-amino acid transport system permease protein